MILLNKCLYFSYQHKYIQNLIPPQQNSINYYLYDNITKNIKYNNNNSHTTHDTHRIQNIPALMPSHQSHSCRNINLAFFNANALYYIIQKMQP